MKAMFAALVGLSLSAGAFAADGENNQEQNVYASQLCHLVSTEKNTSDMDTYTAKLKSQIAASKSSSAMNDPEFNEETAQEVISAWLELGEDERAQLRKNQQQCEQTVMTQFQQQD
ncbi:hypothetical protein [Pantoea sp.]|uniref:hypothetical protein n=1 Tax=Pantoea sp. TaxID=69393 RepID=UPI0031CE717D